MARMVVKTTRTRLIPPTCRAEFGKERVGVGVTVQGAMRRGAIVEVAWPVDVCVKCVVRLRRRRWLPVGGRRHDRRYCIIDVSQDIRHVLCEAAT